MPTRNAEVASMFDQTADLLELRGENPFRVRAYRRAARTIDGLLQSVRTMLEEGSDLAELPGIGKDLAGKIADIVRTGRFLVGPAIAAIVTDASGRQWIGLATILAFLAAGFVLLLIGGRHDNG